MIILCSCSRVEVRKDVMFMYPDSWEATDGKVSVFYENKDCCCIAEEVIKQAASNANCGKLEWAKMADEPFQQRYMLDLCNEIRVRKAVDLIRR